MGWLRRETAAADQQRAMAARLSQAGRAAGSAVRAIEAGAGQVRRRALAAALSRPASCPVASDPATLADLGGADDAERLALLLTAAESAIRAIDEATQAVLAMQRVGRAARPVQYPPVQCAPVQCAPGQCAPGQCAPVTAAFGLASSSTSGTARKNTPAMSSSTSL